MKKNAVIMAAGMSSRFVPLSYEKPKSLIKIKDEILIERQIKQLKEAGINDIILVTGYKAEMFSYLKNFGVRLIHNKDYYRYNNLSSLICAKEYIKNTFICSSDNYFSENIFLENWDRASYSAIFSPDENNEYYIKEDENGIISDFTIGGKNGYIMMGPVFFTEDFSNKFFEILEKDYEKDEIKKNLWENFYGKHLDVLKLFVKKFKDNIIYEFDSIKDIKNFDRNFKTSSEIIDEISKNLNCSEDDLTDFLACDEKLEKKFFKFSFKGKAFVYNEGTIKCIID